MTFRKAESKPTVMVYQTRGNSNLEPIYRKAVEKTDSTSASGILECSENTGTKSKRNQLLQQSKDIWKANDRTQLKQETSHPYLRTWSHKICSQLKAPELLFKQNKSCQERAHVLGAGLGERLNILFYTYKKKGRWWGDKVILPINEIRYGILPPTKKYSLF